MRHLIKRVERLERAQSAANCGGVVVELRAGGFEYQGRRFASLDELPSLPLGRAYLVAPEPFEDPEAWARAQQTGT